MSSHQFALCSLCFGRAWPFDLWWTSWPWRRNRRRSDLLMRRFTHRCCSSLSFSHLWCRNMLCFLNNLPVQNRFDYTVWFIINSSNPALLVLFRSLVWVCITSSTTESVWVPPAGHIRVQSQFYSEMQLDIFRMTGVKTCFV